MPLVILQPFANKDSREHYVNTIEKKVPIAIIEKFVDNDLANKIKSFYSTGEIAVWGVTPGGNGVNVKKWDRINPGDLTMFSANKQISLVGTVTFKFRSKELANLLWGCDSKNQTWEYIYLLDETKIVDIKLEEFNRIVGYANNFIIQGFNVLDEEKSEKVLTNFELFSDRVIEEVNENEYYNALASLDNLDTKVFSSGRKEQQFLRKKLFGNNQRYKCGICGKTYPTTFLVAAHIKKRALCTLEEQKDWKHIVMPMCKFGCDDLYEKGYIGIYKGNIIILKKDETDLKEYTKNIEGNTCDYWNDETKKYFEFHLNQFKI